MKSSQTQRTLRQLIRHPLLPQMAVMDQQDSFSNLSFNSDQNVQGGSSTSRHFGGKDPESPEIQQEEHEDASDANFQQVDPGMGGEILECTVTEPHTENAGTKDAFVSYLITTNVSPQTAFPSTYATLVAVH